ncbi:unnamed protein product, partial [Rotaria socialis]
MSTNDYRHIHHIISTKPLPLLNSHETNHALHYTQTIDNDGETPTNTRMLHRRVHFNDLQEYLLTGASKQLSLHQIQSPSIVPMSQYDDNEEFFTRVPNETSPSYLPLSFKRHYDDNDFSALSKQYVLKQRIIPVHHERATIEQDEISRTLTPTIQMSIPMVFPVATAPPLLPPPVPIIFYQQQQQQPIPVPTIFAQPQPIMHAYRIPHPPPQSQVFVTEHHHHHHRLPTPQPVEPILAPPPPPPPPVPLTTTEITETVRTVRRRPRAKATATIIEQKEPVQRIQTEEVIVEHRRPQVTFEQTEVRSNSISKPSREIFV